MLTYSSGSYYHTQRAPLGYMLMGMALALLWVSTCLMNQPVIPIIVASGGLLLAVMGASFQHLRLEDQGESLLVSFGPLPIFRRRIEYNDIVSVETGRTNWLDGWGIHMSLKGGWVWNLWGFDCVVLKLRRGTLRIGTDDSQNLLGFLQERIKHSEDSDV